MDPIVITLLSLTIGACIGLALVVQSLRSQLKNHEQRLQLQHEVLLRHQAVNEQLVEAVSYLMVKDGGQWVMYGEKGEA